MPQPLYQYCDRDERYSQDSQHISHVSPEKMYTEPVDVPPNHTDSTEEPGDVPNTTNNPGERFKTSAETHHPSPSGTRIFFTIRILCFLPSSSSTSISRDLRNRNCTRSLTVSTAGSFLLMVT